MIYSNVFRQFHRAMYVHMHNMIASPHKAIALTAFESVFLLSKPAANLNMQSQFLWFAFTVFDMNG